MYLFSPPSPFAMKAEWQEYLDALKQLDQDDPSVVTEIKSAEKSLSQAPVSPGPTPPADTESVSETDTERKELIAFARFRERFLKEAFPRVRARMVKDGTLQEHLEVTAQEAADLWNLLHAQMKRQVTAEKLPFEQAAQKLKQIPFIVEEIVQTEILLQPPSKPED